MSDKEKIILDELKVLSIEVIKVLDELKESGKIADEQYSKEVLLKRWFLQNF